ncbi:2OG-Fe(II) oxygenase [Corallococcus sp. AS-1-6]|uniref:2OG-Fe(II) oxygenase n=1 Tax=Corallococcus sp. AS-1-6 TaxID=2874599 RepID=UPI0035A07D6D
MVSSPCLQGLGRAPRKEGNGRPGGALPGLSSSEDQATPAGRGDNPCFVSSLQTASTAGKAVGAPALKKALQGAGASQPSPQQKTQVRDVFEKVKLTPKAREAAAPPGALRPDGLPRVDPERGRRGLPRRAGGLARAAADAAGAGVAHGGGRVLPEAPDTDEEGLAVVYNFTRPWEDRFGGGLTFRHPEVDADMMRVPPLFNSVFIFRARGAPHRVTEWTSEARGHQRYSVTAFILAKR